MLDAKTIRLTLGFNLYEQEVSFTLKDIPVPEFLKTGFGGWRHRVRSACVGLQGSRRVSVTLGLWSRGSSWDFVPPPISSGFFPRNFGTISPPGVGTAEAVVQGEFIASPASGLDASEAFACRVGRLLGCVQRPSMRWRPEAANSRREVPESVSVRPHSFVNKFFLFSSRMCVTKRAFPGHWE